MTIPFPIPTLSDEAQTILCLSRAVLDNPSREDLQRLLRRNLDWQGMVRLAEAQGVFPLFYCNLADEFEKSIPEAVFQRGRARFRSTAQINLVLAAELLHLLDILGKQGIRAVPLRGPVMAAWLYGDLALRQPGDLDLLIQKSDLLRVTEILASRGYRPFFPWPSDNQLVFSRGEYAFVRDPGNIMVDLHWKTKGKDFAIPNSPDLWNRLETALLEGHKVPILSWQDQLLLMSVHGAKHNWRRLIWLCDVAELAKTGTDKAFSALLDQAQSIGISRMVTLALILVNACFQTELPETVKKEADTDPFVQKLARRFLHVLFREATKTDILYEDPLLFIRCMDRRWDQIRYLLQRAFTPTPWTRGDQPISSSPFFLQYLIRPVQMAKTYALPFMRRRYHGKSGK